jgi:hypothetical protein
MFAGSKPASEIHPLAVQTLQADGISNAVSDAPTCLQQRSESSPGLI